MLEPVFPVLVLRFVDLLGVVVVEMFAFLVGGVVRKSAGFV